MSDLPGGATSPLPGPDDSPLASVLADQARRWRAGPGLPVEGCLEQHPELKSDPEAVLDLIYHEVLLRAERGEAPQLDQYTRRFPTLAEALRPIFEVHQAVESGRELAALQPSVDGLDRPEAQQAREGVSAPITRQLKVDGPPAPFPTRPE